MTWIHEKQGERRQGLDEDGEKKSVCGRGREREDGKREGWAHRSGERERQGKAKGRGGQEEAAGTLATTEPPPPCSAQSQCPDSVMCCFTFKTELGSVFDGKRGSNLSGKATHSTFSSGSHFPEMLKG